MGGLPRRVHSIQTLLQKNKKSETPTLVVDAGNALFFRKQLSGLALDLALPKAQAISSVLHHPERVHKQGELAYQTFSAVGARDLCAGLDFFQLHDKPNTTGPWLSANLTNSHGQRLFPASSMVIKNNTKIGIVAISGIVNQPRKGIFSQSWQDTLLPALADVQQKKPDFLLLLSAASPEENIAIAKMLAAPAARKQYGHLDAIIASGYSLSATEPHQVGKTLICQISGRGKYLGVLNLNRTLGDDLNWTHQRISLDTRVKQHKATEKLVQKTLHDIHVLRQEALKQTKAKE